MPVHIILLLMNLSEKYKSIFAETFNVNLSEVDSLRFKECPEWDSVGHVSLIANIEEGFGIALDPEEMLDLNSYSSGLEILKKHGINIDGQGLNQGVIKTHAEIKSNKKIKTVPIVQGKQRSIDIHRDYYVHDFLFKNFTKLTDEEKKFVWEWRNHPDIRKWMVTQEIIPFENHLAFINSLSHRTDKYYWLAIYKGKPVGVLSIADCNEALTEGTPGYYIDPACTVIGIGLELQYAFKYFFLYILGFERLIGLIQIGNANSFQNARFLGSKITRTKTIDGQEYLITLAERGCLDGVNPDNLFRDFVDYNKKNPVNWALYKESKVFDLTAFLDSIAVITDDNRTYLYKDLDQVISRFDPYFTGRGLCFCLCRNTVASLVGYLACVENRYPVVMLDSSKEDETIESLCDLYHPEYIWQPKEKTICKKGNAVLTFEGYELIKTPYECEKPVDDSLAVCLTTSGSTGSPKFVKLSYKNIQSNAESIAEYLEIDCNERPITSLPMHYSYGLSVINSHLLKGATILLTSYSITQREFWSFLKENKATSISGVPYTYELLKTLRFMQMDLPSLKTMTQAGGKLKAEFVKEYVAFAKQTGRKFFVMYGQTEATARMSYLPWEKATEKYSSMGIAIPRGKFSLIDVNGNTIEESEVDGELVYEGPNVSLGYAESRADLAKGDENHGVLHTGDVARRDADGYYYITGRLKRFVKVWGNRCNLDAIEQLAKSVYTDVACVGEDDHIVIVTTKDGIQNELLNLLTRKTGFNSSAFQVILMDAIPKNESGKVQYAKLKEMVC